MSMREDDAAATAEAVARRSYGKLVAFLAARTRDVAAAEDALSEAFAAALADWPRSGVPDSPEGWLMTAAKRKLIDRARRGKTREAAEPQLALMAEELGEMDAHHLKSGDIPDKRLALMFACAHPAIEESIRAPLILQTVMGLSANAIASAFLTSPAAMAKRLVRAKDKIRDAGIPFEVPGREELAPRLSAVLDAIYATFSEGWSDPSDFDDVRRDMTGESLFMAQLVVQLMPLESEALGLAALMMHAEARRVGRRDREGGYVPLAEQDVTRWNIEMISEADTLIRRAGGLEGLGRYELEAALQSAHALRRLTGRDNWAEIVALYDALLAMQGSPVVAINRALAIAEIDGPGAALDALPSAESDARLANYQPYWAARADLLSRWGAAAEASQAYDLAVGLERDPAVRAFLLKRKARLAG